MADFNAISAIFFVVIYHVFHVPLCQKPAVARTNIATKNTNGINIIQKTTCIRIKAIFHPLVVANGAVTRPNNGDIATKTAVMGNNLLAKVDHSL
ncbi:hypothetical protein [Terribacillus saccharophilus]|uniref:hypothetical protein n=1 Tax=Terribacillus saccharophilus TaxID=361277 RepID=UPI002989F8D9|nr:hypothetical protein [Terribacillus saccharophilus]MCM3227372.1 hypothetical protein [Terribacillus saccharophilus]